MRIIAGRLKGRRLHGTVVPGVRPTSDRLRETLFNVLRDRVEGAHVLDAFAGTGAVGLEALSRGAAHVLFVEADRRAAAALRTNVEHCGVTESVRVVQDSLQHAWAHGRLGGPFDLVFLDPPYELADLAAALAHAGSVVAAGGLLVLEHSRRRPVPVHAGVLVHRRTVLAGDSALSLYASPDGADRMIEAVTP